MSLYSQIFLNCRVGKFLLCLLICLTSGQVGLWLCVHRQLGHPDFIQMPSLGQSRLTLKQMTSLLCIYMLSHSSVMSYSRDPIYAAHHPPLLGFSSKNTECCHFLLRCMSESEVVTVQLDPMWIKILESRLLGFLPVY